jgi:hypothetical protein
MARASDYFTLSSGYVVVPSLWGLDLCFPGYPAMTRWGNEWQPLRGCLINCSISCSLALNEENQLQPIGRME